MQWNVVSGRPLANPALVILHVIYKKEFRLPQQVPDFSHCGVQQDRLSKDTATEKSGISDRQCTGTLWMF